MKDHDTKPIFGRYEMKRNLMILMLSLTAATFAFAHGGGMGGCGMGGSGGMMSGAGMMIVADDGSLLVTNMDMSGMMDGSSSTGTFDRDLVNIDVNGNERWRVPFTADGEPAPGNNTSFTVNLEPFGMTQINDILKRVTGGDQDGLIIRAAGRPHHSRRRDLGRRSDPDLCHRCQQHDQRQRVPGGLPLCVLTIG